MDVVGTFGDFINVKMLVPEETSTIEAYVNRIENCGETSADCS